MNRRQALGLLSTAAAFGVVSSASEEVLAFLQPGGWFAARSQRPAFPSGSVIRTVVRDISPAELESGSVQIHEHVGGLFAPPRPPGPSDILPGPIAPSSESAYLDLVVEELKMSRAEGVSCLVDAAVGRRDGRTVENLKQLSTRSGVHIVLGGGYYQDLAMGARYPEAMTKLTEAQLEEELVRDASTQRWGALGEIASSQPMQQEERTLLRAVGKAHVRTRLPIFTHNPHEGCPSCALEQLDVFESVGVEPRRLCIGHLATIKPDAEPLGQTAKALAKRGTFLGFDTVGHMMGRSAIPEAHKVKLVLALLDAGHEDKLLLSADSTPSPQYKANWGQGFSSVIAQFVPKLRYAGVTDETLHRILVDNPRRFLAYVPAERG